MAPTISVIIPTYNRAQLLPEAIRSVLAQTYGDYEIIVVDDGSTDDTRQVLAHWIEDGSLRYHYQDNAGVSAARNQGARLAQGRYLAFLDSDDLFLPTRLEKQLAVYAADPALGFVHCNFSKFDAQGRDLGVRDTSLFQGRIYPWMLQEWDTLIGPCTFIAKDVFEAIGGFDEAMAWAEDLDLWRRAAVGRRVGTVPEVLHRMRIHPQNTTVERSGAEAGFRRYLDKAFADDAELSADFRQRAYAGLYANLGQNLLGEGGAAQMRQARRHFAHSLGYRPWQPALWALWLLSWLPRGLRHWLATTLRGRRYPGTPR